MKHWTENKFINQYVMDIWVIKITEIFRRIRKYANIQIDFKSYKLDNIMMASNTIIKVQLGLVNRL